MKLETQAYCAVSYLWSFTREELNLPDTATDLELEEAAKTLMEEILEYISHAVNIVHNDLDITVS